jgi:hypothetical protein
MNVIEMIFNEPLEDIVRVYLSDNEWYDVKSIEIMGHFGEKPQYFSLIGRATSDPFKRRICGKVSEIKLIEVSD